MTSDNEQASERAPWKVVRDHTSTAYLLDSAGRYVATSNDWSGLAAIAVILNRRGPAAAPVGVTWIECAERMPEPQTPVLVIERGGDRPCCAYWFDYTRNGVTAKCWHQDSEHVEASGGWNGANKDHRDLDVVAWMPLPAALAATPKGTIE